MIRGDFHTHTNFCDGKASAEEMVRAAIDLGMTHIGITTHSHTDFDTSYCIPKERIEEYRREIARLKEEYRDTITVLCGSSTVFINFNPPIPNIYFLYFTAVHLGEGSAKTTR